MYKHNEKSYEEMKYRRCGKSGLLLPAISLGMWQNFGDFTPYDTKKNMILRAFDLGITHFDLANNYGPEGGSAETTMGRVLKEELSAYRDEIIISTKAGYYMWPGPYGNGGSRKYMLSSLDQSLKRMGVDYVDIFYSHGRDMDTPLEETMSALADAVKQGKALYVGISSYSTEDTKKASDLLKSMGVPCLIHQPCYNMLDRWVEDTGLLDILKKEGIGSIAFCPLAEGLLTNRYIKDIPADSRLNAPHGFVFDHYKIDDKKRAMIIKLNEVAQNRNQSLAQMAVAWLLKNDKLTSVLIGASRISQIEENVGALENTSFTQDELSLIDSIIAQAK